IAVITIAVLFTFLNSGGRAVSHATRSPGKAWFSDDDGKNWFADDETKVAPFEHNGKTAYRAYVFSCDGGKTKFVAFLTRFTPEGKTGLERAIANREPVERGLSGLSPASGLELKKPGELQWTKSSDARATLIQQPICPQGMGDTPVPV